MPSLGQKLNTRRFEIEPAIEHNNAVIRSLTEENKRLREDLVSGLMTHEGQTRYVWGTALVHGAITAENAVVVSEPLYIEKAGLATPEEVERFGVIALVKTIQQSDDFRLVRFFDPFQSEFDIKPLELDESQAIA